MNTGFDVTCSRSPSEFARLAKPNPSALFAIAGRYEPSTFAEFFEALILRLNRQVQGLVGKIGVLLFAPNFFEKCLEARSPAKSLEPPLDSIYSPLRHRFSILFQSDPCAPYG